MNQTPQENLKQRLQREAREKFLEWDKDATKLKCKPDELIFFADTLITHTLKEVSAEIGKMPQSFMPDSYSDDWDNISREKAQKLLLGEDKK